MSKRFSSLFIVFMIVAPLAIAVDQGPAQPVPAAETGVKPECNDAAKVNVACGKCGDGRCVPQCGENATNCPADCGYTSTLLNVACGKCGDGRCVPQCGETATSCPVDCGGGGEPKAASSDTKPRE